MAKVELRDPEGSPPPATVGALGGGPPALEAPAVGDAPDVHTGLMNC
jgi:hypothetical protein